MSVNITIRDVPDETRDELAARAKRKGQSMQQYLRRELIAIAERDTNSEVLARIVARHRSRPGIPRERVLQLVRKARDAH
jgi:plasmid stability protein